MAAWDQGQWLRILNDWISMMARQLVFIKGEICKASLYTYHTFHVRTGGPVTLDFPAESQLKAFSFVFINTAGLLPEIAENMLGKKKKVSNDQLRKCCFFLQTRFKGTIMDFAVDIFIFTKPPFNIWWLHDNQFGQHAGVSHKVTKGWCVCLNLQCKGISVGPAASNERQHKAGQMQLQNCQAYNAIKVIDNLLNCIWYVLQMPQNSTGQHKHYNRLTAPMPLPITAGQL